MLYEEFSMLVNELTIQKPTGQLLEEHHVAAMNNAAKKQNLNQKEAESHWHSISY
jgi:hypothetical protein